MNTTNEPEFRRFIALYDQATTFDLKTFLASAYLKSPNLFAPAPDTSVDRASKLPEVQAALQEGSKITAIKEVRQAFGYGLKEAKDIVEAVVERYPSLYRARPSSW